MFLCVNRLTHFNGAMKSRKYMAIRIIIFVIGDLIIVHFNLKWIYKVMVMTIKNSELSLNGKYSKLC